MKRVAHTPRGLVVCLVLVLGTWGLTQAEARAAPKARTAPKVSVAGVKLRLKKLRSALLKKKGRPFDMGAFLKAQGLGQEADMCKGTVASITISKLSPRWRSRTAWSLLLIYRKKGKKTERQACWIEALRVAGRLAWYIYGGPAPERKMKLGKQRWKRRGRCVLAVVDAEHEEPTGNSKSKRFYYTLAIKEAAASLSYVDLLNESHEGVHPTQKRSTFKWKRLRKSQYLIHRVVTTKRGGAYGHKITSRSVAIAVHRLDASCIFDELSRAQVRKLRRKRGGRSIPLPKSD